MPRNKYNGVLFHSHKSSRVALESERVKEDK